MKKRSGGQVPAVLGGLIFLSVAVNVCGKKENKPAADAATAQPAPADTTATIPAAPPPASRLPPEPPPSYPQGASEVPGFETALKDNAVYSSMWEPTHQEDRVLLLSGVSVLLADGGLSGSIMASLDKKKSAKDAAIKLYVIFARIGRFPSDFADSLSKHLEAVRGQAYHGVWSPYTKGNTPHDFSALAMWLNRDKPEYIREFITAKKDGPASGWSEPNPKKRPELPYLSTEVLALERLSLIDTMTPTESASLRELRAEAIARRPGVTMSAYKRLDTGISYEDAVAILGGEGTELSSSNMARTNTVMYSWKGPDGISNMSAMFQNNKLVNRSQLGLR